MASRYRKASVAAALGLSTALSGVLLAVNNKRKERPSWCIGIKAASSETPLSASIRPSWDWNWDKRANLSDSDVPKAARSLKHYIFIRHGEYNTKGYNDEERYLTERGIEQAEMTGKRLADLDLMNTTRIVQSTMTRAKQTCEIVAKHFPEIPILTTGLLREGPPIPPDPPNRVNEPELKYFADGPRIEAAFRQFVHRPTASSADESTEIFICHANVIRYFLCRVAQFPPEGWLRMSLKHGSITWVTVYSDGDVFIRCIGDAGYMPPTKLTS